MIACPNKSSKEWKDLVSQIGEFEAYRAYLKLGDGNIPSLEKTSSFKKEENFSEESLFGLNTNTNKLEFEAITISAVSDFISAIGVDQRFVSEFLAKDGSIIEGALAAANFIDKTVDIIDDVNKRPDAWNKLPEEAAHWWYRLLRNDSVLKGELWMSHKTALKADELYKTKYGSLEGINKPEDLTEEAIGHLIAESIKRIEDKKGSKKDYSFLQKIIKWVNKILANFTLSKQDPFEVAAMKILSSDLSDLLTIEEYTNLTKNSNLQIHNGVIYDQSYLEKKLDENLVDKDKYVHKIKTSEQSSESIASLIKSITTFRKNNLKLQIATDKGYGPSDIIFFPLANGKTGAFVKSTGNFAFKDFYHLLDYKNRLNIGRRTYYLLTDNFTTGTQREFYEQDQNEFARKKAAKEGRFIITSTKNPYLSPRIKKTFFDYIESLKEKIADVPEMLMAINRQKLLLDQYDKKIEEEFKKEYTKAVERFKNIDSDPLVRQSAIDNLLKNLSSKFVTEYKEFFEKLPTIVLVNMNLQRATGYTYGIEEQDRLQYNARPFRYDPFLQEFSPNPTNQLRIIPNTSSIIPTGYEQNRGNIILDVSFKNAIEAVNKKIINNTLNTELTEYEKEILRNIGYKSFVNNVKTKSMAVALEISNSRGGYNNAKLFYKQLQENKNIVQGKLKQKLLTKFPEEAKMINEYINILYPIEVNYLENQDKIFNIINSRLKSGDKINPSFEKEFATNIKDIPQGRTYVVKDGLMVYIAYGIDKGWHLEYEYSGTFEGEYLFDKTKKLTDKEAIELFNEAASVRKDQNIKNAILRAGDFIYDSARYSPDLTAFSTIINSVRNELNSADSLQYATDQQVFSQIYSALILKSGSIYDILKSQYTSDIIQERVNNLVNWVTGGTTLDVLQEKLDNIYEFIKGKDTIVTSFELNLSYNPKLGLYDNYEFTHTVDDLIKAQASEIMINRAVHRAVDNSEIGLLKLESKNLPEGFDVEAAKKLDFPNLTSFPQDFRFTHRIDYVNMPEVSINMLPRNFRDYLETGLLSVNLKDFKKEKSKIRPEEAVDQVFISKTKSSLLSQKEAKYSFDHTATLYYDENSFPYYTLNTPGTKFRVEFSAPEENPFPKELYKAFKLNHGGYTMKANNAIGWFSGKLTKDALYITEVQSDLLQRTYELSNKWLDEKGYSSEHKFRKFTGLKSKLENYYDGWIYVFSGTGLQITLKNNPDIKEIYIPTSEYYKNNVSGTSPYQYYDKIASIFPSATKTQDGKFYKINRNDLFAGINKDTKGYYDVIMKSALSAGVKEQKEITPDIGSDREIAIDILSTLFDVDILSEYLLSPEGEKHLNEIIDYINDKYSDEKPMTGDTQGGELVDAEGNVISDEEESDENKRISDLIKQSKEINKQERRQAPLDLNDLLEQLQEAIKDKDVKKQNFIKSLIQKASDENGDRLFGLDQNSSTTLEETIPIPKSNDKRFETEIPSDNEQQQIIGETIATTIANELANNFGVSFQIVTAEQARELTKDTEVPWNGEPAFFFNGKVYFTQDGFNTENILHEYAHPLVDCLHIQNPQLFNKLVSDLLATAEGQQILEDVTKAYGKDIDVTDPRFAKEILVRGLAKEAKTKVEQKQTTKEFKNFIEKFLFSMKQFLRKVFGNSIKIEKLSTKTTLKELAGMLASEKFNINTDLITHADYVEFARNVDKEVAALESVEDAPINDVINLYYSLVNSQINQMSEKRGTNYADAKNILVNDQTRLPLLQEIKSTLENTAELRKQGKDIMTPEEMRKANVDNFVHAMLRLEIMTQKTSDHLDKLIKQGDTSEVMRNLFYYDLLSRNWNKFIDEVQNILHVENGVREESELGKVISTISNRMKTIQAKVQKAYGPAVIEQFEEILAPLAEGIDNHYKQQIDNVNNSKNNMGWGDKQKYIKKLQDEWDTNKLTKERIKDLLYGKAGDTNVLSALLEDYTNSPDPIVGGFAIFVKNAYGDVDAQFQRDANDLTRELVPLLQQLGYSKNNFTDIMSQLVFKDEVPFYNSDTNKFEIKEVYSFLNPFKNVTTILNNYMAEYEKAMQEGNQPEADRILKEIKQHQKDYFHQEFVDAYYEKDDVYDSLDKNTDLEDQVYKIMGVDKATATAAQKADAAAMYDRAAKEAYRKKHTILNTIKVQQGANYEEATYDETAETIKLLWREYSQLASFTNMSGAPKTGEELLSSMIENKYRKVTREMYEWNEVEGLFEFNLNNYEQKLIDNGFPAGTPEFNEKREKWIKDNTVVKFTKEFYDERNQILSDIREIMDRIEKINPEIRQRLDSTKEMEEFLDIAMGYRDSDGQIMGNDVTETGKERIKELQQSLIDKKDQLAGMSGLNKAESEELDDLFSIVVAKQPLSANERTRFDELLSKKSANSIDKATRTELTTLYNKLFQIQSKEATDYYVDILNTWLEKMGEPELVDNFTAGKVLYPEVYVELLKKDPEFKKWFEKNHIKKEIFDHEKGTNIMVYERLFVWNRTRPNDPNHYESTKLENGEVIQGVPNLSFFNRNVKDEYRTKEVVGKTVNNRGNQRNKWLPKTIADGAKADSPYINEDYEKLKKSNPTLFKLLEKMKEIHLKWQEDTPAENRLYLQVPRYLSRAGENLTASNKISGAKRWLANIKNIFIKSKTDYDVLQLNYMVKNQLIQSETMFSEDLAKIPITGITDLEPDEVSMDLIDGLLKYRHSSLTQKKLLELNPFAQSLKKIVNDPKNFPIETGKWSKFLVKSAIGKIFPSALALGEKGLKRSGTKQTFSVRASAINNFYEREFEGKRVTGLFSNAPIFWRIKAFMTKLVSIPLFGLNIPSAVKNRQAAIIEAYIQAGGGQFLNARSLALGKAKAITMMAENSVAIYTYGNRSLNLQLMQIFDAGQEFLSHSIHNQFGRSLKEDIANFSFLMSQRKFLQFEATVEIMCGMLYHAKVKQTINGNTNEINYIDAFEVRNGQIELKPGIDKEYAPGGKKFKQIKNQIHEISNRLEGVYSRMGQPELNRYFFGQLGLYMKKFFTAMGMNQVAATRPSAALGTITSGNYTSALKMVKNVLKYGPQYVTWASNEQVAGFRKTATRIAATIFIHYLLKEMLGYDDDDYKKSVANMRKRSGDLGGKDFKVEGWAHNQAIVMTLMTLNENETWSNPKILIPQLKDQYIGWGPLYDRGVRAPYHILDHAFGAALGHKDAFYTRDIGPYSFQKKESAKVWKDLSDIFGFTGNAMSPVKQIQSLHSVRSGKSIN
jgi:hypothetical protein